MRFCGNCGSFLRETKEGLWCPKCKRMIAFRPIMETRTDDKRAPAPIFVANKCENSRAKVSQTCPECGNTEAYHWLSNISGEHAGIRRERTIEHFKCTKCSHSWTESS